MNKMFRQFLAASVAAVMLTTLPLSASAAAERFKDVQPKSWYYTAVDYAVSEGLFHGTSKTTFDPNGTFTRGMIVKVLGDMAGVSTSQYPGSRFSDVKSGAWYAPYVEWAAQNGIAESVGAGRFAPNQNVTREQMAVIFFNYAKYQGYKRTVMAGQLDRFSDGQKVSQSARYAMEWAVTHSIFQGSGGRLDPQGTITRAQVAQILYNSRELFAGNVTQPSEPNPAPTQRPDTPQIAITDAVRHKLKPNQDPEKLLDYVLNGKRDDPTFPYDGTTAKWDPELETAGNAARTFAGSWENTESEMRGTSVVANDFVQLLTRTASDRFYITAKDEDGCFCLYYHPADTTDSQKMRELKASLRLPGTKTYDSSLRYEGAGWAGPMNLAWYNGTRGVAEKVEYYLLDMHRDSKRYCLTEPEPGVFYLLYSY